MALGKYVKRVDFVRNRHVTDFIGLRNDYELSSRNRPIELKLTCFLIKLAHNI